MRTAAALTCLVLSSFALAGACSATGDRPDNKGSSGSGATGAGGGLDIPDAGGDGGPILEDPKTCAEAAASKSYVGCEFWPTVVDNIVEAIFDYAVVVANAGAEDAEVTVTRLGQTLATVTVPANGLQTLYLPWVEELKSLEGLPGFCGPTNVKTSTVRADGGAYRLVSTRPVTVYQFSPIEYGPQGGPPGKDWSSCLPGCLGNPCFSYTNDASLLLPSTALTGNYRIPGLPAWPDMDFTYPPYIAVTGTADDTSVTVQLSATAAVAGGAGVPSAPPGGSVTFSLNAGDVVQLVGTTTADFSGSLVKATKPVQVITGISCTDLPHGTEACDHVEESVFPAETLGRHYFVTTPTGPRKNLVGHVVRIYGNVDGTTLTYPGANPGGPTTINAGEVVDLGVVNTDFEIVGDHEFSVASFQLGAEISDPGTPFQERMGDPAQSLMTAVEQYRTKYVFLAPSDYVVSFIDVVRPVGATLTLDGAEVAEGATPLSSGYELVRVELGPGNGGAHVLTASAPVGIQVIGYGMYTSYQYAGGSNLGLIAPPPPE